MPIDTTQTEMQGGCHCGAVRFQVSLVPAALTEPRRCTCSFCRMRGAVTVSAPIDGLTVLQGQDVLTLYQFGTETAKHYFCARCGIYTHHQRRSDPTQFGVNVACLDGISPFDFQDVQVNDGVRHPSDGNKDRVAGMLTYAPDA